MNGRFKRIASALVAVMLALATWVGNAWAGEALYNGIVLPDEWPPRIEKLTREPMAVPYLEKRPEVVPIDVGRQLFVDDFLVEQTTLKRTFHVARYHPASPVLKPDRPWESQGWDSKPTAMVFSDGVWYDPSDKIFKMWYMGGYFSKTCYATSRDGVHWEKPELDVVPGTNIVLDQARDSNAVWLDLEERNPDRRYKMFTTAFRKGRENWKPALYVSADGIHWGQPAVVGGPMGDRSTFFFNPFRDVWVLSIRSSTDPVGRGRLYAETRDLGDGLRRLDEIARPWTTADRLDPHNPNAALKDVEPQLYNLDAVAYESVMLGLFAIWEGDPGQGIEKRNELLLGYSRDGFHWHRPDRRPFAGVNETKGAWNQGNVQSAGGGCVVVGDWLYFYVSGRGPSKAKDPAVTGLAVLRRDGFASMDAGEEGGTLTTRPLVFKGKYLFVNADVAGGELRVEVLDREGKAVGGLARNRCMPITTNKTLQPVRWYDAADLSAAAGKPVRLRFHLTGGRLYSFWVSPDEKGASQGYVAAGGPGFAGPRDTVGTAAYREAGRTAEGGCATLQPDPVGGWPTSQPTGRWVQVTDGAAFSPRDTAENFVLAGKMWVSNGWRHKDQEPKYVLSRDLWCSTDGVDWRLVSEATPYDPYSEMVLYRGKVWAIKGSVWNSADGVKWEQVAAKTPFGERGYGEAVVFKDRIWQLGSGSDVWSTADGVNWTCATKEAAYGNRATTAVAAFGGKLWLIAGRTEGVNDPVEKGYKQYTTYNDVWCSEDGANWTRVVEHGPFAPRMWSVAVEYAGRMWLIGGYDNRNHRNLGDVWTTADGVKWERFESKPQFAARHEVTPYVFDGSLWVVAGNTWPVVNDVWRLTLPEAGR